MKTGKTILLLTVCSLLCVAVYAQGPWFDSVKQIASIQKNDTTKVQTLIRLCEAYSFSYPDTAFVYGQQAYALSEKLNYDNGRLYSIININAALYALGNYALELDYAFRLIPLSKRMNNIIATGFSFGAVGDSYLNLGEYSTALKYYKEVLKIGIRENLPELHRMYSGMVPVFLGMRQYDSASFYAEKGYSLFKTSAYYASDDWNKWWSESLVFNSLGDVFAARRMYDSALYYYRKSLPASAAVKTKLSELTAYIGMATAFKQQHNFDSATWFAQKILTEKSTLIYPAGKQKAATLLAGIYEAQHNADSSLKYLHIAIQLKDSLYNQEKMMAFQNVLFKENEKQRAIETSTNALENRYRIYFSITVLIIVLVIAAIVITARRQKQLQNIRNSIAHDLHDDIGSALSSISIMNELAKAKSPEALPLLTSIGENAAAIQENMSDIVWMVSPGNDHFENVLQRMQLFATEILDAKNIELEFNCNAPLNTTKLSMRQRKNLYLFFKEAINNAAKHSGAKKIIVNIIKKDHHIEMNITDNGKGFDTLDTFNGNGMGSLSKRAEELNATYNIISYISKSTAVWLKFKIT